MTIPTLINHTQVAIDDLPSQWGDKYLVDIESPDTKVQGLVQSLIQPLDEIEQKAFDVKVSYNINTAVGVQLDVIGELLNFPRLGWTDGEYRNLLLNKVSAGNGSGTVDQIQNLLQNLTDFSETDLWEHFPLGYIVSVKSWPDYTLGQFIKDATVAGVDGGYIGFDPYNTAIIPTNGIVQEANLVTEDNDQIITEALDDIILDALTTEVGSTRGIFPDDSEPDGTDALAPICYLDVAPPSGGGYGDSYGILYGGVP